MVKPKLLDLYCGIGGASDGYARAGYEVTGVELDPKCAKFYPFKFINANVLDLDPWFIMQFDLVHASPPCQAHSDLRHRTGANYVDLIPDTRYLLEQSGVPYIIENVPSTNDHLINPITLCGTMFDLGADCRDGKYRQLWRHREFETNWDIEVDLKCNHQGEPVGCYGNGGGGQQTRGYKAFSDEGRQAMGLRHYAPRKYINQAIPAAYAEWIGSRWPF